MNNSEILNGSQDRNENDNIILNTSQNILYGGSTTENLLGNDVIEVDIDDNDDLKKQFTLRSIIMGVLIGGLMCFSNMYFGLQSGWVTMASLQSTLLGFLFFKMIEKHLTVPFNHFENVLLQTISVATATMPLAGGFVGILPALKELHKETAGSSEPMPVYFSWWALSLWTFALAFFGVFFAVPLRKQTILVEKLKFPSGTATAQMIKVLHKLKNHQVHPEMLEIDQQQNSLIEESQELNQVSDHEDGNDDDHDSNVIIQNRNNNNNNNNNIGETDISDSRDTDNDNGKDKIILFSKWNLKWKVLFYSFLLSSLYTLASYFVPRLKMIPIMGMYMANSWNWGLTPSLSYVGQGMIMGTKTGVSMLAGAILGWGILGPIAKSAGWAPGSPLAWKNGAKGWILWVSLFIMLSESIVSLAILLIQSILYKIGWSKTDKYSHESSVDPAPLSQRVPRFWWITGLVVSSIACVAIVSPLYEIKVYETAIAIIMALLTSILAVRALGVTDLNPVSGIGKISQILFAFIAPKNVLSNLVAGAIAEAGAQQAGDMMQDLKTGHLLKASPRIQFYGQMIGSLFSIFFAVCAYQLYSTAYEIPGTDLPAPTSQVWLDMARLVNGGSLATNVLPFCIVSAVLVSLIPIAEAFKPSLEKYLPSGIAFAIGMYVTPNWTIARCIGSFVQFYWKREYPDSYKEHMIVVASGFVLGEGVTSIITAIMTSIGVPHFS
ncbi:hypothetical protein DLAC_03195 [Tieghemostelium lacteum]|uniref:Oligopeptide transporter n=1 Tax=Tieghemostelium lacteum TaxID=361077 RepID=A0A152A1C8_TIELA|nr:hypothetical protein DLAC_03195 [Tieghemostelium lacteum]|eukprot:KYR00052.1 hypothetical protein DLAC_03195 [Tieghemostelium lacteum]